MSTPPPAPTRSDRAECWSHRDTFFQCLNVQDVNVPPQYEKDGVGACAKERKRYEGSCARSWVEYFNKRRVLEIRQRLTLEAAERERDGIAEAKARGQGQAGR